MTTTSPATGGNATATLMADMIRSWKDQSDQKVDGDIATIKANADKLPAGFVFVGQASANKLKTSLIETGLRQDGTEYDSNMASAARDAAEQEKFFSEENAMTSEQISDALYSGTGLPVPQRENITLTESIQSGLSSNLASSQAFAKDVGAAFQSHTLTIQKATDVAGLNYSETYAFSESGGSASLGLTETYNQAFVKNNADGKHHAVFNLTGFVGLYLSW